MASAAVVLGLGLARRVIPQIAAVGRLARTAGADADLPVEIVHDEVELLARQVDGLRAALRGGREELLRKNASLERARSELMEQARQLETACRVAEAASAADAPLGGTSGQARRTEQSTNLIKIVSTFQ